MKTPLLATAALGALLAGCSGTSSSDGVAGGGFETSDLAAVLVDSAGKPVVAARVWLLTYGSDSTSSSTAIDSATSDSLGTVSFSVKTTAGKRYGLEAWRGDTLSGIRSGIDLSATPTVPLRLERTKVFALPCDLGDSSVFVIPQSHFQQAPPQSCQDSFRVLVPPGDWTLFAIPRGGQKPPIPYHVEGDSLPPWRPPPPPVGARIYGPPPQIQTGSGSSSATASGNGNGFGYGSGTSTTDTSGTLPSTIP